MAEKTKPDGWFSRRHQSRDSHELAVSKYRAEHGREARKARAAERALIPTPIERTRRFRRMSDEAKAFALAEQKESA